MKPISNKATCKILSGAKPESEGRERGTCVARGVEERSDEIARAEVLLPFENRF